MKLTMGMIVAAVALLAMALILEGLRWLTWAAVGFLVVAAIATLLRARSDKLPPGTGASGGRGPRSGQQM